MVENLAESKGLPYAAAFVTKTELQTKSNATNMDLSCWIFTWRGMFFNTFFLQIKSALIFFETFFQFFIKFLFHSLYRWFFFSKKKFQETTQDSLVSKSSSCRSRFCRIARARYDIEPPFPPLSNMRKSFLDYKMNIKLPSNIWIKYFRKKSS